MFDPIKNCFSYYKILIITIHKHNTVWTSTIFVVVVSCLSSSLLCDERAPHTKTSAQDAIAKYAVSLYDVDIEIHCLLWSKLRVVLWIYLYMRYMCVLCGGLLNQSQSNKRLTTLLNGPKHYSSPMRKLWIRWKRSFANTCACKYVCFINNIILKFFHRKSNEIVCKAYYNTIYAHRSNNAARSYSGRVECRRIDVIM